MLAFATIAEQVAAEFRDATKTASIATLAKKRRAEVERTFDGRTTYIFDDDSSLITTGRAHNIETHLP
jgi:hypothetical protein